MHTPAEKRGEIKRDDGASLQRLGKLSFGGVRERDPTVRSQRTSGDQAVARPTSADDRESSFERAATLLGHDFSRIPVYNSAPVKTQRKLMVNTPGDFYEQEADRAADNVIRLSEGGSESQGKPATQQHLQTQRVPASVSEGGAVPPIVHRVLRSPGQPLEPDTRRFMEPRFGHDFSQVRVHTDARAAESARAVDALAYTVGRHIVFGAEQYTPSTRNGRRLLAHELTHVVQQGNEQTMVQRQQTSNVTPATDQDSREFVQATISFFNSSADYFRDQRVSIDQARFERLINNWYLMVVDRESMIDNRLGADAALKTELRASYTAAIRVLISRAATIFGKSEDDLYRENSGRIPMWAWQTPHHLESGISTPIAEGRSADVITGAVAFSTNGFDVTIAPDTVDRSLGSRAETRFDIDWTRIGFMYQSQRGRTTVTTFTGPATPIVHIQTFYGPGVTAASPSGYGRGTTPEDIAGGRVTPRSTSLGFHEGSHGLDYVEFLENNPPPQFTGAVGMTVAQFRAAMTQWQNDTRDYVRRMTEFSMRRTDCVGTTIDRYNQAQAAPRHRVVIVCAP